jgi:hypothetical protein
MGICLWNKNREEQEMSFISEAHAQWHMIYRDTPWDCPLDCGAGETDHDPEEVETTFVASAPTTDWGDAPF